MNKKITTFAIIGIISLSSLITPLQASAYSSENSIGSWTYKYINGKLTRLFIYTDKNTQAMKNTTKTETTLPKYTNKITTPTSSSKGHWTYEYVNGKLTRKFVYPNEKPQSNENTNSTETTVPKEDTDINNSTNPQKDIQLTAHETQLYNLINQERKKAGLSPVKIDMNVVKAARLKSEDMAKNHYFSHQSPTYGNAREMLTDMNIHFSGAAENIAINGSISRVHSSFMSSSTHKSNILSNGWTHVGLGISKQTNGTGIIVTEIFLRK